MAQADGYAAPTGGARLAEHLLVGAVRGAVLADARCGAHQMAQHEFPARTRRRIQQSLNTAGSGHYASSGVEPQLSINDSDASDVMTRLFTALRTPILN